MQFDVMDPLILSVGCVEDDVATCWKPVTATNNTSATTNKPIGRFPNDRLKMASPATAYEP
jgi:hypothetical protein